MAKMEKETIKIYEKLQRGLRTEATILPYIVDWPFKGGMAVVAYNEFGPVGVVKAQSFDDAMDIAYENFWPAEEPEDEEDAEYGIWLGNGSWLSDVTVGYATFRELR